MDPGPGVHAQGWGQNSHMVKMHSILKNRFIYPHTCLWKTKYQVMMSIKSSTLIVKLIFSVSGFQTLRRGLYDRIMKIYWFFFCTITVIGKNRALLLCTLCPEFQLWSHCPGHGTKVKSFYRGGGIHVAIYRTCIFTEGNCYESSINNYNFILRTMW